MTELNSVQCAERGRDTLAPGIRFWHRPEMLKNRSVPTDIVLPHITYQNVAEAINWLAKTFGFVEHYRYGEEGGKVSGAQMHLGDAWIMLNQTRAGSGSPAQLGYGTQSLTVFVENVDEHFQRTKLAGAKIVEDLHETVYGERQDAESRTSTATTGFSRGTPRT